MPLELDTTAHTLHLVPDDPWTLDAKTGETKILPVTPLLPAGDYHLTTLAGDRANSGATFHFAAAGRANDFTLGDTATTVLDDLDQSMVPGSAVGPYAPNGGANQTWRLAVAPDSPGAFILTNGTSGLRLSYRDGKWTQQREKRGDLTQVWKIEK